MHRKVPLEGKLYIEVPDASRYRDRVNSPFQDFNTEHINHYSQASLVNMAARAGLTCVGLIRKDVLAPPPYEYPCLGGLFRVGEAAEFGSDHLLKEEIKEYVQISRLHFIEVMEDLTSDGFGTKNLTNGVYLWGAGEFAFKLLARPEMRDVPILGIVDSNPARWGWRLKGIPVIGPDKFVTWLTIDSRKPILVATILHQEAIAARIKEMGLPNEVITLGGGR